MIILLGINTLETKVQLFFLLICVYITTQLIVMHNLMSIMIIVYNVGVPFHNFNFGILK